MSFLFVYLIRQFEGQTKTKLGNSEVKSIVESVCSKKLTIYLEQNPQEAKKNSH